jgi:hypothetical protein
VVESLEAKEPKSKLYRAALDKLEAKQDGAAGGEAEQTLGRNLLLGARNLEGVELMLNSEVHPYHLLRSERVIFSRPALEKLQESLMKSAAEGQKGGGVMATTYTVIRRAMITEKALAAKETEGTLVFEVDREGFEDAGEAGGGSAVQGEGACGAHREHGGQGTPPRQVCRLSR